MKRVAILCAVICILPGCGTVRDLADVLAKQPLKPGEQVILVDEDKDGKTDVALVGVADAAGVVKPVLNADTGQPVEVEGSREAFTKGDIQDDFIADSLAGWAAILGLPVGAGLGALIRTIKPSRKLAEGWLMFKSLVSVIQKAREDTDFDTKGFDAAMSKLQPDELATAIKKVKAGVT